MWYTAALTRVLNFLNDRSPIFFLTTDESVIGNTSEQIHLGFLYARHTGKKIILIRRFCLLGHPLICNRELFDLTCDYSLKRFRKPLQFACNLALTLLAGFVPATAKYFAINAYRVSRYAVLRFARFLGWGSASSMPKILYRPYRHHWDTIAVGTERVFNWHRERKFTIEMARKIDWEREYNDHLPITIDPQKLEKATACLVEMGLTESDWFVCLHVREGGFRDDQSSPRNSNIVHFEKAIRRITESGGWVVRLGDRSMTPLSRTSLSKINRVIDYPFTNHKSELMDLYLIQNCRLFLGQGSGVADVALLFQKKSVLVNMVEWTLAPPPRKNCLCIIKHVFSKKLDRYLSIQELLKEPFEWQEVYRLDQEAYSHVDNTPDEICDALDEMLTKDEMQPTQLQQEFIERRKAQLFELLRKQQPLWRSGDIDRMVRYRITSRISHTQGTLGQKFLEQNWQEDQLNAGRKTLSK